MYKKIIFDKIILMLGLLFIFSCSNPNNPNSGDGGFTGPTEEELIKKYGIDIGQDDATIIQQIGEKLQSYFEEYKKYRVVFTGNPRSYDESLSSLIVQAVSSLQSITEIDVDIRFINFNDYTINGDMFSGPTGDENIAFNFIFPENKITTIKNSAFRTLSSLKQIVIPDSVITIEAEAFYYCYKLEKLTLSKNLKTIGDQAFLYTQRIKELVIPDSVTSIGVGAFSGSFIETLKLSSSLETIGDSAFDSSNIKELTIPASVKSIGSTAFAFSQQLTTLTYLGTAPDAINNNTDVFIMCDSLKTLILPNVENPQISEWQNFLGGNFITVKQQ